MNIQNLMQQAQKMQKKMTKLEEEFKLKKFNTEAGGGVVKVEMSGDMKLTNISIADELINSDDKDMLQDLFIAAVNQSIETVKKEKEKEMSKIVGKTGGLPGLF